jgi:hypothetical protein
MLFVRALIRLEQRKDQTQFKLKNASTSITGRRRRDLTCCLASTTQDDIEFGGKGGVSLFQYQPHQLSSRIVSEHI